MLLYWLYTVHFISVIRTQVTQVQLLQISFHMAVIARIFLFKVPLKRTSWNDEKVSPHHREMPVYLQIEWILGWQWLMTLPYRINPDKGDKQNTLFSF